jgi:hypothetical protein
MQLELIGPQASTVLDALEAYKKSWQQGIREAEAGLRPNFSVDGARLLIKGTEEVISQLRWQLGQ